MPEFRIYADGFYAGLEQDNIVLRFESAWGSNPNGIAALSNIELFKGALIHLSSYTEGESKNESNYFKTGEEVDLNGGLFVRGEANRYADILKAKLLLDEHLSPAKKTMNKINEFLENKDPDEVIYDFEARMEDGEGENTDSLDERLESIINAIDSFSEGPIVFNDISVAGLCGIDDEEEALEVIDANGSDRVDLDFLNEWTGEICGFISILNKGNAAAIIDRFELSESEIKWLKEIVQQ